jgi:hypothetical protein
MNITDKAAFKSWMEGAFSLESVLIVGGQLPGDAPFQTMAPSELEGCKDEGLWNTLADAVSEANGPASNAPTSVWTFEYALLWLARRADGAWLAIFTERDITDTSRQALRARLDTFVA